MTDKPTTMTAGQAIVDGLVRNGIRTLFGIPGIHTYQLFDALYERREEIRFIGTRHEQGGAYMAYGHAKSTGSPAAYTCVPGPGVLNTTAALCTAYAANAPVLCVTSEIPSNEIGQGHGILHELPDQLGTLRLLTKWAGRIDHPAEAHGVLNEAFRQMQSGRMGPVAIECPWDTLGQSAAIVPVGPVAAAAAPPDSAGIARAAAIVAAAKNPMIMLGSGAIGARAEVNALAELLQCPATAHRSGRGIVGEDTPHGLNCAAAYAYWLGCDVLIAIGTRMELQFLRWRKLPEQLKIVRIDIDPREMVRRKADVGVVADAQAGAAALLAALAPLVPKRADRTAEFAALRQAARAKYAAAVQPQVGYLDVIREVLPRDGLLVEEICQMGFTARFAFPVYAPNTYISCGYQDNLGFGYMTSLGVKVAHPDKAVVSINGDGGFMFGVQELATAVQHGINVVAIVFNNRSFGNVVRDQEFAFKGHHIGDRLVNPDFTILARAFGALAHTVRSPEELRPALTAALAANAPVLIEVLGEPGSEGSPWPFLHPWASY